MKIFFIKSKFLEIIIREEAEWQQTKEVSYTYWVWESHNIVTWFFFNHAIFQSYFLYNHLIAWFGKNNWRKWRYCFLYGSYCFIFSHIKIGMRTICAPVVMKSKFVSLNAQIKRVISMFNWNPGWSHSIFFWPQSNWIEDFD